MIVDPTKQHDIAEYWRLYKEEGDQRARDQLILAYSPLVKYVAGRMSSGLPAHIEEADLVSYGLLGLIGALERFDLSRSIKFETYAISRIKGSIIEDDLCKQFLEEDDRISLVGMKDLKPGKPVTGIIKRKDGSSFDMTFSHTFTDEQIEWFKAGSALNTMGAED